MAIAYEQSRLTFSTGDTFNLSFTSSVKSGSLIVVILTEYDSAGVTADAAISDNQSNIYSKADNRVETLGNHMTMEFWYTFSSSAGTLTITADPQRTSTSMAIHEFSGIVSTSSINVQDINNDSGTDVTAGPITTTVANTLLFAAMTSTAWGAAAGEVITPDGDYTQMQEYEDGDSADIVNTQYRIVSSTLTDTANWTLGASWFWIGWVVAFKASTSSIIEGTTCWGHSTGVLETNTRTFASNWTGTGSIELSGDSERLALNAGEYMESEVVNTGSHTIQLLQNNYASGDTVTLKYRHGSSEANCLAAAYSTYSAPFDSSGFVQVRVESTL